MITKIDNMAQIDKIYNNLLTTILNSGYEYLDPNRKEQRVYRRQVNHYSFEYDLSKGFPALTTKKLAWKSLVGETLWILKGDTNIKYLMDNGIPIWNKDAYNFYKRNEKPIKDLDYNSFLYNVEKGKNPPLGDVGKNYGWQLRNWGCDVSFGEATSSLDKGFDQLKWLVGTLQNNPMATKKVITYWNPAEKHQTALTPCHRSWEVMVRPLSLNERSTRYWNLIEKADLRPSERTEDKLDDIGLPKYEVSLSFDMSSVDTFLGLPFNIASYALITHILAKLCNMEVGVLYANLNNVHIYNNHTKAAEEQLSRDCNKYSDCHISFLDEFHYMTDKKLIGELDVDDILNRCRIDMFKLEGYDSYPPIKAEMLSYDN